MADEPPFSSRYREMWRDLNATEPPSDSPSFQMGTDDQGRLWAVELDKHGTWRRLVLMSAEDTDDE